jgi:hypothetical protein
LGSRSRLAPNVQREEVNKHGELATIEARGMSGAHHATESGAAIAAKVAPPLSVSIATVYGVSVSEILLWATLLYTLMMIGHKAWQIYRDVSRARRVAVPADD